LALRRWSFVFFYLGLTVLALNALVMHLGTALPGTLKIQASNQIQPSEFDIFAWDLWWVRHAVFELHVSPLYTNYVVYPFTSPLAGHTLVLLWGLVSAPFQAWLGLAPTFNGIILFCFVAAGSLMYLFARRHTQHASAALLAGLILAFTPAMIHRASLGHLDKLSVFWLPLALLIWDRVVESRRWTWAMVLGVCLYFSWLTDFQQTMWIMCLLIPYAIYTLFAHPGGEKRLDVMTWAVIASEAKQSPALRKEIASRHLPPSEGSGARNDKGAEQLRLELLGLGAIALAALIVPALLAPVPQLLEAKQLNYPPAELEHAAYFAFLPRYLFAPGNSGDFSIGVVLPLLTLMAAPFIQRDGRRWLWLGIALMCFVLALGPFLKIGTASIPLPYILVHRLLGDQYRTPMRFATPGVLALAMLVALTLDRAMTRFHLGPGGRWLLAGALSLAFVWDYRLWRPFPITRMPDYSIYHTLAAESGDFALLEIPIGVRTGFAIVGRGEYLQYYQTIHHRPIPTGYLSRLPGEITDVFYYDPLLGAFSLSQALPPDVDARLEKLIRDLKIGYVILHRDLLEPDRVVWFGDVLDRQPMLERMGEEGPLVIYRARSR